MQLYLMGVVVLLTMADHWTTYRCLNQPIEGWTVTEANPLADWLFSQAGLTGGLWIDSALTLVALGVLLQTQRLSTRAKLGFLAILATLTAYAVVNNLAAMAEMGVSPFGAASGGAV